MADEEDIVQRIRFEGEEDVIAQLQRIATVGVKSFQDIRNAGAQVGGAFSKLSNEAQAAYRNIEGGSQNVAKELGNVRRASEAFRNSIVTAAANARTALGNIASSFKGGFLTNQFNAISSAAQKLGAALVVVGTQFRNAFSQRIDISKLNGDFQRVGRAAQSFGASISSAGSALGTFARRSAIGFAAAATVGVAAFRNLARAATGASAAERVASRERLADIRDEKGDVTGLQNIRNQANESLIKINNDYGRGKLSLEDYTTALQEQQEQTAANTRQFLLSDSQEQAARKRQFESMKKLREQEAFDSVADKVGNQAAGAFLRLGTVIDQVFSKLKTILGPTIANLVNGITQAITANQPLILQFAEEIRAKFQGVDIGKFLTDAIPGAIEVLRGAATAVGVIISAFQGLLGVLNQIAGVINSVFGTNISGAFLAGALAVGALSGAFTLLLPLLRVVGTLIVGAFSSAVPIIRVLATVIGALVATFGAIPVAIAAVVVALTAWAIYSGTLQAAWESVATFFSDLWDGIASAADTAIGAIEGAFQGLQNFLQGIWDQIKAGAQAAWDAIPQGLKDLVSAAGSLLGFSGGGAVGGYAEGGAIRGRGTGTSDSILARLSNGEFVQRTAAVRHYGVDFMNALNNLRVPRGALPGFNLGGLVNMAPALSPSPILRFADGGAVDGPKNALTLVLDGQTFAGMLAPDDVFEGLKKKATKRALSPRTPSWY